MVEIIMQDLLSKYKKVNNIFYSKVEFKIHHQTTEFQLRSKIAKQKYSNYFNEIFKYHSICVMDHYVKSFLIKLPKNAVVLDVGSGWCWHWRNVNDIRPDVKIIALDFIEENFLHSIKLLPKNSLKQIYFIHDDFNTLNINNESFDAVWSSQAFQHMKNLDINYKKVHKLLKKDGYFYNFNLNENLIIKIKNVFKSKNNFIKDYYFLNRDINNQKKILKEIFNFQPKTIYCEFFFHPEINFLLGKENSFVIYLENFFSKIKIFNWMARQVLFKLKKC